MVAAMRGCSGDTCGLHGEEGCDHPNPLLLLHASSVPPSYSKSGALQACHVVRWCAADEWLCVLAVGITAHLRVQQQRV